MITAYGDAETRRKAIERGAVDLLTKPIDFALLRTRSIPGSSKPHDRNHPLCR
jgi:DNA-binding response OmpR family regulator